MQKSKKNQPKIEEVLPQIAHQITPSIPLDIPKVKEDIPKILLEIFLYGEEKDKKKIRTVIEDLSKQLNQARTNKNKCRVLWYLDNGEKSVQEKLQWFDKNTNCKYFIALDGTKTIKKNFIKDSLQKIRIFENSFNNLKSCSIKIFGKHDFSKKDSIKNTELFE